MKKTSISRLDPWRLDPWRYLRQTTRARIAIGRSGGSLPTGEWLDFKLAHAKARDAVHQAFDVESMEKRIEELGTGTITVDSAASDRMIYLQRPDLGRRLDESAVPIVAEANNDFDLVIIVTDGLSATAAHEQIVPLLKTLLQFLKESKWRIAPIIIARFGRVALQDQIGSIIGAKIALSLIGERPGLGSPDSLGAYLVFGPKIGNTDANRNCVSNIRPEGLKPNRAAESIFYLLNESRRCKVSGVTLKDERRLILDGADLGCLPSE